jgi:prepilin-type N-terminal cleavage/methylation domain-containing protein
MARRRLVRRRRRGFTLVELMVSLVMFSFAIAGVLAVAVSMANGFREQRAGVGTEGAARAAMEFLSDAIRGASPGMQSGIIWPMDDAGCAVQDPAANNNRTNSKAFHAVMGDATASDSLTVTFAYGSVVTTALTEYVAGPSGAITVEDTSQFSDGDFIVVTDFANAVLLKVNVVGNTLTYALSACTPVDELGATKAITIPAGALVVRALRARFYVQDLDGIPTLFMDPNPAATSTGDDEPLAEGIEDLQVVLGIDSLANGLGVEDTTTVNADEWIGNLPGESIPAPPVAPTPEPTMRAVRLSLVARAIAPVAGTGAYFRPALEDRDGGTADKFKRRVLTSIIEVRNMLGSK